jgi:predicted TIM-barrel fold metal-dependent hydrolase
MLQALARHRNTLRGVACIGPETTDDDLERMTHNGVRGVRLDMRGGNGGDPAAIEALAQRLEPLGLHLELQLDPSALKRLAPLLGRLPVDCVIEHFGLVPAADGVDQAAFKALLRLVRGGRCWVKLSGVDRICGPPWHDTLEPAQALIGADPTRLLWGSDWPHAASPGKPPGDRALIELIGRWAPDARLRHLILVDNPARLYRFGE